MIGSTSSFVVQCGPCFGTGQRGEKPCSVCHSRGALMLQGDVAEYSDCPICHGSGYPGVDVLALCNRCEGVGAVYRLRIRRPS